MYLLDTNVIAELPRARPNRAVLSWIEAQPELALSAVTVEELTFGVERLAEGEGRALRRWLDGLLAIPPVIVALDGSVAQLAGRLRARRERAGRRVAQADMLIAASALASGRTLATRNTRDFVGLGLGLGLGLELLNPFERR